MGQASQKKPHLGDLEEEQGWHGAAGPDEGLVEEGRSARHQTPQPQAVPSLRLAQRPIRRRVHCQRKALKSMRVQLRSLYGLTRRRRSIVKGSPASV